MVKPVPYLLLRLLIGISLFGHGLVRLPKLDKFSGWMVKLFEGSMLPQIVVEPYSYVLPFAEFITGIFICIGLFTRYAVIAGILIIFSLLFGSTMIEQWDAIPGQLIHGSILIVLLNYIEANHYSIDYKIKKH